MFSGGASSSYMSWLIAQKHPSDTILLHTPTYSEHEDADRFREQVAAYIGLQITPQADGRDIWELIDDNNALPSNWMPFCTRILKIEQTEKFCKSLTDDFILYYGYGADEWRRVQKQTARFETSGIKTRYPIFEQQIPEEFIKNTIINEWGICLPEPYLHLKHNNCIPCFKGGKAHFYAVWKYYPDRFWKASQKEKEKGHTVFQDETLEELAAQWTQQPEPITLDGWDTRPCMCAD